MKYLFFVSICLFIGVESAYSQQSPHKLGPKGTQSTLNVGTSPTSLMGGTLKQQNNVSNPTLQGQSLMLKADSARLHQNNKNNNQLKMGGPGDDPTTGPGGGGPGSGIK